jgi:hypothetical protein
MDSHKPNSILFIGDTFLRTRNGASPFAHCTSLFDKHDLIILNLETAITNITTPEEARSVSLACPPERLQWLRPFRDKLVVSLANNHTCDFGQTGLMDTIENLTAAGIRHAPLDAPFMRILSNTDVALHCLYEYSPVDYQMDFFKNSEKCKTFLNHPGIQIAFVHWGEEHVLLPSPKQLGLARKWIDAGMRLIVGHHSHAPVGKSEIDGNVTVYSMGNFNFAQQRERTSLMNRIGYMLSVEITRNDLSATRLPYIIDSNWCPRPVDSQLLLSFFQELDGDLADYEMCGKLKQYRRYYTHSSRSYILSNLLHGFIPRVRDHGIKQLLPLLKWLISPRSVIRYPFMLLSGDNIRKHLSKLEMQLQETLNM